jgi:ABC-2 type transport system ATP-binding protein
LVRLDLEGTWDRPVGSLSGGQRRRLDIALGLINTPSLLFLDEPTTGLDPQARVNLWDHINSLRTGGATVFLTTHYLEEADSLCDRVMVIDAGRIIAEGTPASLKQSLGGETARLALRDPSDRTLVERTLRGHPLVSGLRVDDGVASLRLSTDSGELPALFDALRAAGVAVAGVEVHRPTLEDVFLSLTGRALRDEPPAAQEAHADAL